MLLLGNMTSLVFICCHDIAYFARDKKIAPCRFALLGHVNTSCHSRFLRFNAIRPTFYSVDYVSHGDFFPCWKSHPHVGTLMFIIDIPGFKLVEDSSSLTCRYKMITWHARRCYWGRGVVRVSSSLPGNEESTSYDTK